MISQDEEGYQPIEFELAVRSSALADTVNFILFVLAIVCLALWLFPGWFEWLKDKAGIMNTRAVVISQQSSQIMSSQSEEINRQAQEIRRQAQEIVLQSGTISALESQIRRAHTQKSSAPTFTGCGWIRVNDGHLQCSTDNITYRTVAEMRK